MATPTYSNPDGLNGNYNSQEGYAPDPGSTWVNANGDLMGSSKGASGVSRFGNTSDNDTKKVADTNQTNSPNAVVNESFSPSQLDPVNSSLYSQGVTPQQMAAYYRSLPAAQGDSAITKNTQADEAITDPDSALDKVLGGLALAGSVGALTAGAAVPIGAAAGAALGAGSAGAGITAGAADGAVSGLASNLLTTGGQQGLGKSVGVGALMGGIGGGLGYVSQPATGALANATGMDSSVANGLVRGALGAGTGALGSELTGGNPGTGALVGGASGAANGYVGSASGSPILGSLAGTIGGALASKYATPSTTPSIAAPTASTPARAITPTINAQSQTAATPVAAAPSTNIGPYAGFSGSGLGYQPMSQVNSGVTNYNTYGQGPEASFFAPTPGTT